MMGKGDMQLTRRSFIASLTGALVAPRLALPAPPEHFAPLLAPELVAFCKTTYYDPIMVTSRVVLFGDNARRMVERDPHLWSAVMVDRQVA